MLSLAPSSAIHDMDARLIQPGRRCNTRKMAKEITVWVSPLLSDKLRASKSDSCNPNMIHPTLVFLTSGNVNSRAPYFVKTKEHSQRFFRERTCISNEQYHEFSGVENVRENLALSEISQTACHLIAGAWQDSTSPSYELAWKWVGWCSGKEINPFRRDISPVLEFLGDYLKLGISTRQLVLIGQQFISNISELMEGVFNVRPPQLKYTFIWDVQTFPNFVKENWRNNKEILTRNFF